MTFISVITPAYNAQKTIARAVNSVIGQTHADWEMIIVADDGQDYDSILRMQGIHDPRLRFATTGIVAAGPAIARNIGLDTAAHDIIINLDADDTYSKTAFAHMLPAVITHGACTPKVEVVDDETEKSMPMGHVLHRDQPLVMRDIMRYCATYAPIMVNRRWCEARWPEIHYGEDLLFWVLLLDELPAIYYVSEASYEYRHRIGSLSRPDEKTTHAQCERRNRMITWLDQHHSLSPNIANRDLLKHWLLTCNDMEELFEYKKLDLDIFFAEINRRFDQIFSVFDSTCNINYS